MSRRFNYTGRRRLTRDCIHIHLQKAKGGQAPSFSADLQLPEGFGLPPQAKVYVEAYAGTSSMRFDFGTVTLVQQPGNCLLEDIDEGAAVLFRVKVVDESEHVGRLLASASGIRPEGDDVGGARKALLPLEVTDLCEEIWQLDVDEDAGPTLLMNNSIPGIKERLPNDVVLTGSIYPEVVRQMARMLWNPESHFDDGAQWVMDWKQWLEGHLGREVGSDERSDPESLDQLVNDVASNFSSRYKLASLVASAYGAELEA